MRGPGLSGPNIQSTVVLSVTVVTGDWCFPGCKPHPDSRPNVSSQSWWSIDSC